MRPAFFYFDLGNVLVHFDHSIAVENIARLTGAPFSQVKHLLFDSGLEDRYETGLLSSQEYVEEIERSLGVKLNEGAVLEGVAAIFKENLAILPVFEILRELGLPIGILSNTCEAHWKYVERQDYGFMQGEFDQIVLSYEVKSMKPERRIYEVATERAGVEPERIFFVDDRIDNIEGAKKLGWEAELFTDAESLIRLVDGWRRA